MRAAGPVTAGEGRLKVSAWALAAGCDWVVSVQGGEKPHAGAVALACPCGRPGDTAREITCSAGVLTAPGHRDDLPARALALKLCKALQTTVSVTVGIHVDHGSKEEIEQLMINADAAADSLLMLLKE